MVQNASPKEPVLAKFEGELFAAIASGVLTVAPPATLPLADAAEAHRALEARETTGAVVLTA